ncbi:hypothetical protein [Sphingomonas sp. R86521]|uniref:hypothetical protein n=1 Tax=Sphingomonas sp. R86521 TaxID=3093860 RepID=UPI0036D43F43
MTLYVLIFWIALPVIACSAYAWGGRPERIGAAVFTIAAVATIAMRAPWAQRYHTVSVGVLIIDASLLLALGILTVKADRWWPTIALALQTISTLAHVAKAVNPGFLRLAYAMMSGASSYPTLIVLSVGIWNHHRRRTPHAWKSLPHS